MAAKITITHPPIPEVVSRLKIIPKTMEEGLTSVLRSEGEKILTQQRVQTPVDRGILQSSNEQYLINMPGRTTLTLENNAKYAKFVEFGTGVGGSVAPPEYLPPGTEWVYGDIKGHRAQPFFYPAAIAAGPRITALMEKLSKEGARDATDGK